MNLASIKRVPSPAELSHLLGRCLFGISPKDFDFFRGKTIEECVDILLTQTPENTMLAQEDPDIIDPLVPHGSQWVGAPYENEDIDLKRRGYLRAWWMGQIINRDYSLTEKMTLFWHNHFVTEMDIVKDARYSYLYVSLLRSHSLGNFKMLIREGSTNPAMLVYLNGNSNSKDAPNENYGRELLELFTMGKDAHVKYSEADVKAAARVLTGWRDDKSLLRAVFTPELHDTQDKCFSSFFDNACIKGKSGMNGAEELDSLVNIIFRHSETAKFLCRNLYRWFVCAHIDDTIESAIIDPLSEILIAGNFEVMPVLKKMLCSEHFFDPTLRGCIIKNPIEFWIGAFKQFDLVFPSVSQESHLCWIYYSINLGGLMMIGDPPSVAGWPAFYQAPKFHSWWINSYTLAFRMKFIDSLLTEEGLSCNGPKLKFDFMNFLRLLDNTEDAEKLVTHSISYLLSVDISATAKEKLKKILEPDLDPKSSWSATYARFRSDPNDYKSKDVVEKRLNTFFRNIISLPEYQLM